MIPRFAFALVVGASILMMSCDSPNPTTQAPLGPSDAAGTTRLVSLPQGTATCRVQGDRCIIGGDAYVDLPAETPVAARSAGAYDNAVTLWPNGTIRYFYASATAEQKTVIRAQMNKWQVGTGIKFTESTTRTNALVITVNIIQQDLGGNASLGKTPNPTLNLYSIDAPVVLHELGHVIGLTHEQERTDRESYMKLNKAAISLSQTCQDYYLLDYPNVWAAPVGTFDYASVMIYSSSQCAASASTPVVTKPDGSSIPYNTAISAGDIAAVKRLYTISAFNAWGVGGTYSLPWVTADTKFGLTYQPSLAVSGQMNNITGDDVAIYSNTLPGYYYLSGQASASSTIRFSTRKISLPESRWDLVQSVAADFTGDGYDDILTAGYKGAWSLLPGAPAGPTFPAEIKGSEFSNEIVYSVTAPAVALKVDGDAKFDFVRCTKNKLFLWTSKGAGFNAVLTYDLPAATGEYIVVKAGDFDGDGKQEIARLTTSGLYIHKLVSNATTGWTIQSSTVPVAPTFFAPDFLVFSNLSIGDFNGDGVSDILWNNQGAGRLAFNQSGLVLYCGKRGSLNLAAPIDEQFVGTDISNSAKIMTQTPRNGKQTSIIACQRFYGVLQPLAQGFNALGNVPQRALLGSNLEFITGDFNGDGKLDLVSILPNYVEFQYGTI